jgi:peptide deformylase
VLVIGARRRNARYGFRMTLKIRQAGDPVLRERARALSADEIRGRAIQELIEHMRETMLDAPGVGLAAPQIGLPLQLAVVEDQPQYLQKLSAEELAARERSPVPFQVLINPAIIVTGSETAEFFEGCLSVAGFAALVPRARRVRVECLNERAEPVVIDATGWYARILQHEIDHLQGALYIDRMNSRSFSTMDNHTRYGKEFAAKSG